MQTTRTAVHTGDHNNTASPRDTTSSTNNKDKTAPRSGPHSSAARAPLGAADAAAAGGGSSTPGGDRSPTPGSRAAARFDAGCTRRAHTYTYSREPSGSSSIPADAAAPLARTPGLPWVRARPEDRKRPGWLSSLVDGRRG